MKMAILQVACLAIVLVYLLYRRRSEGSAAPVLRRMGLFMAASWIGEQSMIRAYGFYHYSPDWGLFLGDVPVMVVCIWPVVIDSAWGLARGIGGRRLRAVALIVFFLVLMDASLIEPIAVASGLWSWNAPGLFGVPPVGLLGWAVFAASCIALLRGSKAGVLFLAPLLTHGAVIAAWWGALRWVSAPISATSAAVCLWGLSLPLAALAWRQGWRRRVPRGELLVRLPAALFFFALLLLNLDPLLAAYALAFVPFYLAIMDLRGPRRDLGYAP